MQKGLHPTIKFFMKCSLLLAIAQMTFIGLLMARNVNGQDLNKRVTISFKNTSVKESLLEIQSQSGIRFVLPDKLMDAERKKVNFSSDNITVKAAIEKALAATNLEYRVLEGYVVIDEKPVYQEPGKITGKVFDEKGGPLPGATIRVLENGQTTQSDMNGHYTLALQPGK
jgi:hypothetical protein